MKRLIPRGPFAAMLAGLLIVAAAVLVIGITLQASGLQNAANAAQLAAIVLAVPPLVAPLFRWLMRRSPAVDAREGAEKAGIPFPSGSDPIHVTAEILDTEYLAVLDDGQMFPVGGHAVQLYVESSADRTVILRRLRASVASRGHCTARLLHKPTAGILEPRKFSLLLGEDPPRIEARNPGVNFPFSVSPGDPEVIELRVSLAEDRVDWFLLLDWTSEGRQGTFKIDAAGMPFVTIGRDGLKSSADQTREVGE